MNVLFLSPASADRQDVAELLIASGHMPIMVETAAEAGARAQSGVDLIVLDLGAPEALRFLRKRSPRRAPVICIADRRQPDASSESLRLGVADIVARPVRADDLIAAMVNAGEFARLANRPSPVVEVARTTEGVFGASPAMRDVLAMVRRVAKSRCGVLIVGERGTGREMIARAIHAGGPRRDDVFIKFSCGDLDGRAFEASLDAETFRNATLYLEDVEELAGELQARIESRVAQGGEYSARVIGGAQPRINEWVERGTVRRSFLETIAVVRLDLPSLRQRTEDVPLLATHFLKDSCSRNDVPAKTFTRSALTLLAALPWPGNAAELRALCERLTVLVSRGVVTLEDVLANVRLDGAEAVGRQRGSLRTARARFERDYMTAVLQHHRGRMGPAAKELGIERTNLYRKIKQLKIEWTLPD